MKWIFLAAWLVSLVLSFFMDATEPYGEPDDNWEEVNFPLSKKPHKYYW